MNKKSRKQNKRVAIIGGGITGLFAAYCLQKKGYRVTIFEKNASLGGLLGNVPIYENTHVDKLYHHIFPQNRALLSLVSNLDLKHEIIWKENQAGFIKHGLLHKLNSPFDLLKMGNLNYQEKIRLFLFIFTMILPKRWKKLDRIKSQDLIEKKCSSVTWEKIFSPILSEKFCDAARDISSVWLCRKIRQKIYCRSIRNKEMLGAFKKSSKVLIDALARDIRKRGGMIYESTSVGSIIIDNNTTHGIEVSMAKRFFDYVVSTVSVPEFLNLLPLDNSNMNSNMKDWLSSLNKMKYLHSLCVLLRVKKSLSKYYWLFIRDKQCPFSFIVDHSNLVNSVNTNHEHIIYLARYFSNPQELMSQSDEKIFSNYLLYLKRVFPHIKDTDIIDYYITRAPQAQPIFQTNYLKLNLHFDTPIRNVYLLNTSQLFSMERTVNDIFLLTLKFVKKHF